MKKILIIFTTNLIIITIIIAISSILINKNIDKISNFYVSHNFYTKIDPSKINIDESITEKFTAKRIESNNNTIGQYCGETRESFGRKYKKRPIIVLGCSYAYGHGLNREETFPYRLSQLTHRPVYNFSTCGSEAIGSFDKLESFFIINNDNKEAIKNAQYVIYVYMHDHLDRYLSLNTIYNHYKMLFTPSHKNIFLYKLLDIPLLKLICSIYQILKVSTVSGESEIAYEQFFHNSEQYLKKIMLITYEEAKKYSPNAKVIIILYDQKIAQLYDNLKIRYDNDLQYSKIWEELNNETDMTIVHSKDITGFLFDKNYKLEQDIEDWHPNAKAWQIFTPKFAKKYIN